MRIPATCTASTRNALITHKHKHLCIEQMLNLSTYYSSGRSPEDGYWAFWMSSCLCSSPSSPPTSRSTSGLLVRDGSSRRCVPSRWYSVNLLSSRVVHHQLGCCSPQCKSCLPQTPFSLFSSGAENISYKDVCREDRGAETWAMAITLELGSLQSERGAERA